MFVNDFSHLGVKGRLSLKTTPKKSWFLTNMFSSSLSFSGTVRSNHEQSYINLPTTL